MSTSREIVIVLLKFMPAVTNGLSILFGIALWLQLKYQRKKWGKK